MKTSRAEKKEIWQHSNRWENCLKENNEDKGMILIFLYKFGDILY